MAPRCGGLETHTNRIYGFKNEKQMCVYIYIYPRQLQQTPGVTPQAIPLPNYERIPFTACWDRLSGVFQRCVETILEYMVFSRKYKRIQMILFIYIYYILYIIH